MPSENQYLLPFSVTVCDSHLVSRCGQGKADASNDRALVMQMAALCCLWWLVQCEGAGQHCSSQKQKLSLPPTSFLWEGNSSREAWSQPFPWKDHPKAWPHPSPQGETFSVSCVVNLPRAISKQADFFRWTDF